MSRLKNITSSIVSIQMFKTATPKVNFVDADIVLSLKPGEDVDEALWRVNNINDPSYNVDLLEAYIEKGIITRIP